MKRGTVLHIQKVAGISGSEAHLLSLLPRLKERGWDIRFLMLHEHEPGARDFARELTSRGIPLDSIPLNTAAVPPFVVFLQADSSAHLGVGLMAFMIADLSTAGLRLVETAKLDTLLDELHRAPRAASNDTHKPLLARWLDALLVRHDEAQRLGPMRPTAHRPSSIA